MSEIREEDVEAVARATEPELWAMGDATIAGEDTGWTVAHAANEMNRSARRIRAAILAWNARKGVEWRTMDSVPKDGIVPVIFIAGGAPISGFFYNGKPYWSHHFIAPDAEDWNEEEPTLWLPLAALAPKAGEG